MTSYVLTVSCPSKRGIVAALSGYLAEMGCNIVDSSQFDDLDTDRFSCASALFPSRAQAAKNRGGLGNHYR